MSIANGDLLDNRIIKRDEKGRILPGSKLAPNKRKHTEIEKLKIALKKAGRNQNPPIKYWDAVAEAFFKNKEIMKAIINKLVPNISEITGAGGEPINITLKRIIYSEIGKEDKENIKE